MVSISVKGIECSVLAKYLHEHAFAVAWLAGIEGFIEDAYNVVISYYRIERNICLGQGLDRPIEELIYRQDILGGGASRLNHQISGGHHEIGMKINYLLDGGVDESLGINGCTTTDKSLKDLLPCSIAYMHICDLDKERWPAGIVFKNLGFI